MISPPTSDICDHCPSNVRDSTCTCLLQFEGIGAGVLEAPRYVALKEASRPHCYCRMIASCSSCPTERCHIHARSCCGGISEGRYDLVIHAFRPNSMPARCQCCADTACNNS